LGNSETQSRSESKSTGQIDNPPRIAVLDAFRALAIVPVVLFHYSDTWVAPSVGGSAARFVVDPVSPFSYGWLGVEFFFMISGFVIFMSLQRTASIADFAVHRFARLYPALIVCCFLTFLLVPAVGGQLVPPSYKALIPSLFLVSDYLKLPWVDGGYWSLTYEVTFYFWIALAYFRIRRHFIPALAAFTLLSAALPQFAHIAHVMRYSWLCAPYMPFFAFGVACYLRFAASRWSRDAVVIGASSFCAYLLAWHSQNFHVHLGVAAMALLFFAFLDGRLSWLAHPLLVRLGQASYSLYLLNGSLGWALLSSLYLHTTLRPVFAISIVFALMIVASQAMYAFVERPARAAIVQLYKRQAAYLAASAG
jgi:peptidoglycan/LPS O-acetylase OafA/YrhL